MVDGRAHDAPERAVVTDLVFTMVTGHVGEFYPIFLQGFGMTARLPCDVKTLLCDQFGLEPDYVEERITTIFLNGKATDKIDEATVGDGATIALSAAMPGLVGATMRRVGYYAAMRGAITHHEGEAGGASRSTTVRVKLFNLLLQELGPGFLQHGVLLGVAQARDFFEGRDVGFWKGCSSVLLNGTYITPARLRRGDMLAGTALVRLVVHFRERKLTLVGR